jgi:hypothetical protein
VVRQLLNVALAGKQAAQGILDKCSYTERRLMRMQYSHGDTTRQLAQGMNEIEEERSSRLWLERRLRYHFEAYTKSGSSSTCLVGFLKFWRCVCTEAALRGCRDMALQRTQEPEDKETKCWNTYVLNNYGGNCQFCTPLNTQEDREEMERLEVTGLIRICLKSQLMERRVELEELEEDGGGLS